MRETEGVGRGYDQYFATLVKSFYIYQSLYLRYNSDPTTTNLVVTLFGLLINYIYISHNYYSLNK